MADNKDPQKLTDNIAKQENAEDLAVMNKYVVEPIKKIGKRIYDNVMGPPEKNEQSTKDMAEHDAKYPDSMQAKVNRAIEKIKPTRPVNKAKGGMISSASKRADGCAIKGKTKGRML